jgi:AraC family transcriptional regulator
MPSWITPRELTKWVPGKVLSASDALGWKDVGQRTYRYVGQDVAVPGIDHFTIVRYCVGASGWSGASTDGGPGHTARQVTSPY